MGLMIPAVYFFIAFAALWQSYRDPQVTLVSLSQNTTAIVFFAIFIVLGFLLFEFMSLSASGDYDFYLMVGFSLCWGFLGLLWILRKIPRESERDGSAIWEVSDAPQFDMASDPICEMSVARPWYLQPFDYIDRLLLKIAGLCLLIELL